MNKTILDPAPITRFLRAKARSHILVAAVHHLGVFEELAKGPAAMEDIKAALKIKDRPSMVLFPSLCAMGVLSYNSENKLQITELGNFLVSANPNNVISYLGLEKNDPGVLQMADWIKNDGPADDSHGLSYVKDEHAASPMDEAESARFFTLALAGRARFLSPLVAAQMPRRQAHLLDVAGGTGYYSYEWLLLNPSSTATIADRPEVLKTAAELLDRFCEERPGAGQGLKERVHFLAADMLVDDLPKADILLAASLFHDWSEEVCRRLAMKFADSLEPGGELWVHDAFLNDTLDGPIAVTDYSAVLFTATRGRAYSRKEYREWFMAAGLTPSPESIPTMLDYSLISASK